MVSIDLPRFNGGFQDKVPRLEHKHQAHALSPGDRTWVVQFSYLASRNM